MPISKRLVAAAAMLAFAGFASPTRADDAFRDRLAHAQGKLASAMVQKLAASKKPMIVISPASVAGAAAAIDLGASASLRTALHGLLGFHPDADVPGDLASLRDSIGRLGSAKDQTNYPLTFASSVVFDDSVALYPAAPMALKQAGVDFAVKDLRVPETIADVNRLVAERTHGLIPEIVDRNVAGASLLVLNALHFKDRWKTPFDRSDTQPVAFRRVGANPVTVSMMHLPQGKYLFRQDKQFVGIEMPYAQERFAMVVVTTRGEQPAAPAAFAGTGEWLAGKGFAAASGELALPHFDVSAS
ncbi:MAG: hypothetical protein J0H62_05895, partial [Rhizobiales bacterium]|nr:hypothetical protein [Hyphomicrobiales bacterium]